jgi:hypothetical protein
MSAGGRQLRAGRGILLVINGADEEKLFASGEFAMLSTISRPKDLEKLLISDRTCSIEENSDILPVESQ